MRVAPVLSTLFPFPLPTLFLINCQVPRPAAIAVASLAIKRKSAGKTSSSNSSSTKKRIEIVDNRAYQELPVLYRVPGSGRNHKSNLTSHATSNCANKWGTCYGPTGASLSQLSPRWSSEKPPPPRHSRRKRQTLQAEKGKRLAEWFLEGGG